MLADTAPVIWDSVPSHDAFPRTSSSAHPGIELSVVIPCLNEVESLGHCLRKAQGAVAQDHIAGEIIVADNGSTDGSRALAQRLGARVIAVREKGYGCALRGGIAAARGQYVIMGDADDSYDFTEIPRFLAALRQGQDLVMGCRLSRGGGRVLPGAMPALHRWVGNPLLSRIAQSLFAVPVHDIYCGLRGFAKRSYHRWGMESRGMEFAIEMVIKASLLKQRVSEIPIILHPDGRQTGRSHLRTFRDGWRSLLFMLQSRWYRRQLTSTLERCPASVTDPGQASSTWQGRTHDAELASALVHRQVMAEPIFRLDCEKGDAVRGDAAICLPRTGGSVADSLETRKANRPLSLARCWDELHTSWVHLRRVRILAKHLATWLPRDVRVLDVGCGDGLLSRAITDQRPDLQLRGVEIKRRLNCHIACDEFDGQHLQFADGSFDVVLLIDVLHHTADPRILLREATRVASLAVVVKDHILSGPGAGFTLRVMDRLGNRHHGVPLPFTYWTRKRWLQAISEQGLRVGRWEERLNLYPWPVSLLCDRSLHFLADLEVVPARLRPRPEATARCLLAAPGASPD